MSDYTKTVDFAAKDSLPSGNSGKIIKGTEFETEFDNIATAIATKANLAGPTFTGVLTFASFKGATGATVTTILDEDDMATNSDTALATQQSIKAYVDAQQDTVDTLAEILALGNATGGTDIAFGDNDKAIFGAGSDLQIYHDGSAGHSFIQDAGTGNLYLRSNGTAVVIDDGTNNLAAFNASVGESALYYGGSGKKLATTATGIDVTGSVTADGLQVTNTATTGTNQEVASFRTASGGGLVIRSSDLSVANPDSILEPFFGESLKIKTSSNDRFKVADNGDISFYEDTGTTPKFFWDASAESLGIGTSSVNLRLAQKLDISASASYGGMGLATWSTSGFHASLLDFNKSASATIGTHGLVSNGDDLGFLVFRGSDGDQFINAASIGSEVDGVAANNVMFGSLVFYTNGGTPDAVERLRIDSSGNVGIGTNSPQSIVHIDQSASDAQLTLETHAAGDSKIVFSQGQTAGNWAVGYDDGGGVTENSLSFAYKADGYPSLSGQNKMILTPAGNVGLGSTAPDKLLVVQGASAEVVISDTSDAPLLRFRESGVTKGTISTSSGALIFDSGGDTERMRLDASGNLLVGKTSSANAQTTVGHLLLPDGRHYATASGGVSGIFSRTTSDGDIVSFYKDGTTVGSIGTRSSGLVVGSGDTGLFYDGGGDRIFPESPSGGAARDAAIDLGTSAARFKDLYLSGGAYLGGTGAANKLDDYETGTFTPTVAGDATGAFGAAEGYYTKVGRLVFIELYFTVATNFTSTTVGGLPFTVANLATGTSYGQSAVVLTSAADTVTGAAQEATTNVTFYNDHNILSAHAPNTTNSAYRLSMCYQST